MPIRFVEGYRIVVRRRTPDEPERFSFGMGEWHSAQRHRQHQGYKAVSKEQDHLDQVVALGEIGEVNHRFDVEFLDQARFVGTDGFVAQQHRIANFLIAQAHG